MRVWLVTIGEPVPIEDGSRDRLHRTGAFARYLAAQGHEVVWWTSTFDHFRKKHISPRDLRVSQEGTLEIRLLHAWGYHRNISLARFVDHAKVASKFKRQSLGVLKPDVIVAALPTIDLCSASVAYGLQNAIPVVLDMRDMWPDIFVDHVPSLLRPLGRLVLSPLYWQARRACERATAIIGITEEFVDWGLRRGRRQRGRFDRAFPIAYEVTAPSRDKLADAEAFWDTAGIRLGGTSLTACYFGGIGSQLDLAHVIEAARLLHRRGAAIRFVLCGRGERLEECRQRARGLPNVLLPGWVEGAQIWALMRRSQVGLDPLPERHDFLATVNNKAVEYLSAGLPVISSPRRGVLFELLHRESCGLSYEVGAVEELAEILQRLHADRPALAKLASHARTVFAKDFAAPVVHECMMEYLSEVVASASPVSSIR